MDSTLLQQTPLQPDPGIGSGRARTPLGLKVFGVLRIVGGGNPGITELVLREY